MTYEKDLVKYNKKFREEHKNEIDNLSKEEKKLFDIFMKERPYSLTLEDSGYIENLNKYIDEHYSGLKNLFVPKEFLEYFEYTLERFTEFQYNQGYSRRSFRSKDYSPFLDCSFFLMHNYY
ncbi:MAG: hypothetical protein K6G26_02775, partial [Lachnospiraceae bacterium]|nr:hypothetical protein [Lachnospiraceae bacterium]